MDQFQLFVIIDQSRAWTSDKNQAIYYTAQILCLFQSPLIKKSCVGLFLWNIIWELDWFEPVGQIRVYEFHIFSVTILSSI